MIYFFPLGLFLAFWLGFYLREVKDTLKAIRAYVAALKVAQDKKEQAEKPMGFAGTMTMAELNQMEEDEKIQAFNRNQV